MTEQPSNTVPDLSEVNAGYSCLEVRDRYYRVTERREGFVLLKMDIFRSPRVFECIALSSQCLKTENIQ